MASISSMKMMAGAFSLAWGREREREEGTKEKEKESEMRKKERKRERERERRNVFPRAHSSLNLNPLLLHFLVAHFLFFFFSPALSLSPDGRHRAPCVAPRQDTSAQTPTPPPWGEGRERKWEDKKGNTVIRSKDKTEREWTRMLFLTISFLPSYLLLFPPSKNPSTTSHSLPSFLFSKKKQQLPSSSSFSSSLPLLPVPNEGSSSVVCDGLGQHCLATSGRTIH